MLKEAETFKGQERTNTNPETSKSLRPNPNALPVQGSMARVLLQVERDEEIKAEEKFSGKGLPEEEARRILLEDAIKRNDQDAILAIPREDTPELHGRWLMYIARLERDAIHSSAGPSADKRKVLREKRKKKR